MCLANANDAHVTGSGGIGNIQNFHAEMTAGNEGKIAVKSNTCCKFHRAVVAEKPRGDLTHVKEPKPVLAGTDHRHVAHHFDLSGKSKPLVDGEKLQLFVQNTETSRVFFAGALYGVDPAFVRLDVHAGANVRTLRKNHGLYLMLDLQFDPSFRICPLL